MSTAPKATVDGEKPLRVRRGRVESVDLYEIKENELDLLEKGSPADLQLNFAIFLLSIAFAAICALVTATFARPRVETIFLFVSIVGIALGLYLLAAWYRNHTSSAAVCTRIRSRIPPDAVTPKKEHSGGDSIDDKTPAG
jgi:hypothetical protein